MSRAPSWRRRLPREAMPTTGSVAIDSRGNVVPVLIRGRCRGEISAHAWPWELANAGSWWESGHQKRPRKLCRLFRLKREIQLHNREKSGRHKRNLRQLQLLAMLAFWT